MSRHKLVKTMDLDDELDVFDGADYDDDSDAPEEELSADDKAQLQRGLHEVRATLGPTVNVSDKTIEDSLWHYYYDVEKTVNYILQQQAPTKPKQPTNVKKSSGPETAKGVKYEYSGLPRPTICQPTQCCLTPLSAAEFFMDCPWLRIPLHRRGDILIEPLHPRGGLLGGSPAQTGPKMSKLAALAAARRKKENAKSEIADEEESKASVASLRQPGNKSHADDTSASWGTEGSQHDSAATQASSTSQARRYPRKKQEVSPSSLQPNHNPKALPTSPSDAGNVSPRITIDPIPTASPSTFATTICGSSQAPLPMLEGALQNLTLSTLQDSRTKTSSNPFTGPSPDDVVTQAQGSSKGATAAKKPTQLAKSESAANGLAEGTAGMKIDESLTPKNKNLDVLAEYRKAKSKNAVNFVVIGHVDAGKSTLMGRLLFDLKVVDQRTVDRYRKEAEKIGKSSFALAWVLDQGTEERNRGVTIDIAMNKFETPKTRFTILDAPGHRDFIPNMIAGASQADFAVLVIDASTGNFESGLKGQTKEHALLVRSMGVQRVVIAVNKLDTVQWSKERFDEIQQQVNAFLTTAGFQSKNIAFVPCSGLRGDNITKRAEDPRAKWYTGPVLIEQLEASDPANRALDKPLRLTIGDIFRGGVQNPLSVSGRLDSGSLQVGDKVLAMPAGETAIIKGIEVDSEPSDWAVAGQIVTLHLTDIEQKYLKPGDVLCPPSAPIKNITSFTVKILAFEHVTPMHVDIHKGRLHVPGRIARLVAILDKGTGAVVGKKKPKLVQPGSVARVVVEVETAIPLEAPGRVVLRAGGETVAAGLLE
ncbi:MAG: hypothetical protein Q9220_000632 [cf. Caloplaca sp. 1 TL-2023]